MISLIVVPFSSFQTAGPFVLLPVTKLPAVELLLKDTSFCRTQSTTIPSLVLAHRGKIAVASLGIHAVVHGDEPDVHAGEYDLSVMTNLQVVAPEATHVFHDDRADLSCFHQG